MENNELKETMVKNEFFLSELSGRYPNALQQGIWPSGCLMKNKEQFYLCDVESRSYS